LISFTGFKNAPKIDYNDGDIILKHIPIQMPPFEDWPNLRQILYEYWTNLIE
jgi:hypothetical protein